VNTQQTMPLPLIPSGALQLAGEARFCLVDGEGCLFDLRRGRFLGLNRSATTLLNRALTLGMQTAVQECSALWRVTERTVANDLTAMIQQLAGQGFLLASTPAPAPHSTLPLRNRFAVALVHRIARRLGRTAARCRSAGAAARLARQTLRASWLALRLLGFEQSLEVFRLAAAQTPEWKHSDGLGLDELIQSQASRMLLTVACKERSVAAWFLLQLQGAAPQLVIGLQRHPFRAHAWVQCAGQILTDNPEHCEFFVPVAVIS
jgi:hypothetical protein